jgi:hypothetical protein
VRAGPKATPTANRVTDAHEVAQAAHQNDQRTAARVVASHATDVEDCTELLGMLGLGRAVGLLVVDPPPRR